MNKTIYILTALIMSVSVSAQTDVQIKLKGIRGGKTPLKFYVSDIKINNSQEKACWIIFSGYVEDTLMKDGVFHAEKPWTPEDIVGKGYTVKKTDGSTGKTTEIHFLGKYKESFHAFLVPGKSTLFLQNYSFETDTEPDSINIVCANALMVNDSIELEKFLPYKITSDKNLTIDVMKNSDWNNLNWDEKKHTERTDLPKNEVRFIHATGMTIFRKPLKK